MSAPLDPRVARLESASDPAPSAHERGPVARLQWRHGLDVDVDLARVTVDTPAVPMEWSALLAETHAALLDPTGLRSLDRPSPIGVSVTDSLRAAPAWQGLADAARSHPLIAREAVVQLADVVKGALLKAGARSATDARRSLADLDAARAALERARAAQKAAQGDTSPEGRKALREALKAATDAQAAEERAHGAVNADAAIAQRTGDALDEAGDAIAAIAQAAQGRADAAHAFSNACGSGVGVGGTAPLADDVVKALTPEVAAMLRAVGAIRKALQAGRAARHVRGREGMVGVTQGGIEHAADLTSLALAGLAGHLGSPMAALTRLALVESRADVVEKGGGLARNGDVIVVVDQSGSMEGPRALWAGALALAVLLEARADGRTAALVTFDTHVRASIVVDSPDSLARAVVALSVQSDGGTGLRAALSEACAVLGRMPHGGDPADALLITDGGWDADALQGWPDRARLRGCFIGGSAPTGSTFASTWEVRATEGVDAEALAVEIASVIV